MRIRPMAYGAARGEHQPPLLRQRRARYQQYKTSCKPHRLAILYEASMLSVGSRTGAVFRRSSLSVAPRFLWECHNSPTVNPSPAPAASHVACGFPALRAPAHFTTKVMRPIRPERLPRSTAHRRLGTPRRVRAFRTAIPCSTASTRSSGAERLGPSGAESSFYRMFPKHRLEYPIAK